VNNLKIIKIIKININIGALTNKAYAFQNRPWDLIIVNTIDVYDSLGSSICIYLYGSDIKRILPLKNDYINED
jgi:NADH dehydrogenase/NADH:ubiquinone oxidoreductase subunit G